MLVLVVDIRIMLVRMPQAFMMVWMRMRLGTIPLEIMLVLVMGVVVVGVVVVHRLVLVLVFMRLGQVQPDTRAH